MKGNRIVAVILAGIMIMSLLAGCGKQSTGKDSDVAMGRYVEEAVSMPEAVESGKEIAYIITVNSNGEIEVYTISLTDSDKTQYILRSDGTWKKAKPEWLQKAGDVSAVCYAADGTRYLFSTENNERNMIIHFYKSSDESNLEEILLDDYKKEVGYDKYPYEFSALENGSLVLGYEDNFSIYKDGKEIGNYPSGSYIYGTSGNQVICIGDKGDKVNIIDAETGTTVNEIPNQGTENAGAFASDQKGTWYMASETGIHRLVKNGTTWETVLDGSLASMVSPANAVESLLLGNKDDFYIMYQGENGKRILKHYVYDKNVASVPSKTLSIVSIMDDYTVRQAIVEYQQKNPNVKVEFQVAMAEDSFTTNSDYVKKINTELLAGKGADIIMMDDMPIDSFIEKGVLADISGTIDPLVESGEVQSNFIDGYRVDGKLYTAPYRFTFPYVFGLKDAVKSMDSSASLADYTTSSAKAPIFGSNLISYTELAKILYRFYSDEFITSRGELDKDGLVQFMENVKRIGDQTKALDTAGEDSYESMNNLNMLACDEMMAGNAEMNLSVIRHMYDVYSPIAISKKLDIALSTYKDQFYPCGLVGVNNASKNKDIASDFIKVLYSEPVQKLNLGGFPTNTKALDNFQMEPDDFYIGMENFEATQPSTEDMKEFLGKCKTLSKPVMIDVELMDMIVAEMDQYFKGDVDAQKAADNIIARTKAYMAE